MDQGTRGRLIGTAVVMAALLTASPAAADWPVYGRDLANSRSGGGISTTGGAVYVAVGLGPPPMPAPQGTGPGAIVALGDTSRSGANGDD